MATSVDNQGLSWQQNRQQTGNTPVTLTLTLNDWGVQGFLVTAAQPATRGATEQQHVAAVRLSPPLKLKFSHLIRERQKHSRGQFLACQHFVFSDS
jgi:hypothetical protein